jgi:hypothetical protein
MKNETAGNGRGCNHKLRVGKLLAGSPKSTEHQVAQVDLWH